MVTFKPRASNIAASEAAAIPFPNDETTPPVTKIYLVVMLNPENKDVWKMAKLEYINERFKYSRTGRHYTESGVLRQASK